MQKFCPLCEGRMVRFRYSALRRFDQFGRQIVVYKCIECGQEKEISE